MWHRQGEGLKITAKGSKDLVRGHHLHLIVVIAYGREIILKKDYEKMIGEFFAGFIRRYFNLTFGRAGSKANDRRLFVINCLASDNATSIILLPLSAINS